MDFTVDFSPIGKLGDAYREAQFRANRERTLAELGQGAPLDQVATKLFQAGDVQGGMSLANLANTMEQQKFNRGIAERQIALQEQQAKDSARGYDYKEVDDGNGGKALVRIERATGKISKPAIEGAPTEATNPFAYGKQNESQSKDSGFANRMFRAESVLRDPRIEGRFDQNSGKWVEGEATNLWENTKGMLPGFMANYATSPEYQKFDQARRDFINAVLRRESGAAIAQSEFDNATKQYFPQPGDSKERIEEKRKNRQDAIASVAGGGGQSYKPPFMFNDTGEMVPTGNQRQGVRAAQPSPAASGPNKDAIAAFRANPRAVLDEARAAVAKGADPAAVAARIGIHPSFLGQ